MDTARGPEVIAQAVPVADIASIDHDLHVMSDRALIVEDIAADGGPAARRGPEKRRRLLEYLRQHPEELRPTLPRRR